MPLKLRPLLLRFRPRVLTLVVLIAGTAVIALANITDEISERRSMVGWPNNVIFDLGQPDADDKNPMIASFNVSYGWPLLWRQYVITMVEFGPTTIVGPCRSAYRFAGDLTIWIVMLVSAGAACEWLFRRYRPRPRWGLRTMLLAMAVMAPLCARLAAIHQRANAQDSFTDMLNGTTDRVKLEYWGPRWLDLLGADRFRRRIVGAQVETTAFDEDDEKRQHELLGRLRRLPDLQYLLINVDHPTPVLAESLAGTRRPRILSIDGLYRDSDDPRTVHACLSAIGKMAQLEHLELASITIDPKSLACLAGLTKLKSLSLTRGEWVPGRPPLSHLPLLPALEALDLSGSDVTDESVAFLAALPHLRALSMAYTDVTDAGIKDLASLEALEELAIGGRSVSLAGVETLFGIKRLKKLHLGDFRAEDGSAMLALDDDNQLSVPESELDAWLRVLAALRRSRPEIIIDTDDQALDWDGGGILPWHDDYRDRLYPGLRDTLRNWKLQSPEQ